jgi:hypothetical protein
MKDFEDKKRQKLKEMNEIVHKAYEYEFLRDEIKKLSKRLDNLENQIYEGVQGELKEYKENSGLLELNPHPKPVAEPPKEPPVRKEFKPRKKYFTKKMRERMHYQNKHQNREIDLKNSENQDSNNSPPNKYDNYEKYNEKKQNFEENKMDLNNFENYNSSDNYDDQVQINFDDGDDIPPNLEENTNKSLDDKFFDNQLLEVGDQQELDDETYLKQEEFKNYQNGERNDLLKRKRKVCSYPLTYKLKAILMNDDIKDHTLTAKYLGIPPSTIRDWIAMREKIENACKNENGNKCKMSSRVKRNRDIYNMQY